MSGLVQLEELVLSCRDEHARRYIAEAVACYNAGAYRACIVTTWIAVVFDILGKLRELTMSGDAAAKEEVDRFIAQQENENIDRLLRFERDILDLAKNRFELLSSLEYDDLKRLQRDRHRCAHPSMHSDESIYSPPAELARLHLRSAVEHLVSRPPVQGKAALDRILSDVRSEYFPPLPEDATLYLKDGPLSRPRDSLVRGLVTVLLKDALQSASHEGYNVAARRINALIAVRSLHTSMVNAALDDVLSRLLDQLAEEMLPFGVLVVSRVSGAWEFLTDSIRLRLQRYVRQMPEDYAMPILGYAAGCSGLQAEAEERLMTIDSAYLPMVGRVFERENPDLLVRIAVERLRLSRSYASSNHAARVLIYQAARISAAQARDIVEIICTNGQVRRAWAAEHIISGLVRQQDLCDVTEQALADNGSLREFGETIGAALNDDWIPF